jgi:Fe-S cluster biogenesis protein NfuA
VSALISQSASENDSANVAIDSTIRIRMIGWCSSCSTVRAGVQLRERNQTIPA